MEIVAFPQQPPQKRLRDRRFVFKHLQNFIVWFIPSHMKGKKKGEEVREPNFWPFQILFEPFFCHLSHIIFEDDIHGLFEGALKRTRTATFSRKELVCCDESYESVRGFVARTLVLVDFVQSITPNSFKEHVASFILMRRTSRFVPWALGLALDVFFYSTVRYLKL